jgi:DNA/RNA-binding domain of Phe-tRNA-synthetase-like protein
MTAVFEVAKPVFERVPAYVVGCVVARGIDNTRSYPDIDRLLDDAEEQALVALAGMDLKQLSQVAVWRDHFSAQGWSPSRYPASVEALLKRVARGDRLPRINPVVDLANAAVLLHIVPIGTHDVDTFGGAPLAVRLATSRDTFIPMGADAPESPDSDEIVYAVRDQVRTRRWVWRQSVGALIGPHSTDIFFPIDGFAPETISAVEAATCFIAAACREQFNAHVCYGMVDASHPTFATEP